MIKHVFIIFTLTTLSACATLTGGHEQEIAVSTTPAGAKCLLTNGQESWTIETTPGAVSLPRAYQPIRVSCSLTRYETAHITLEPQTRGRAYGNILLLGLPTLVDASTGAGYEYTPEAIALTLTPTKASPAK
ncbi:MAG: hypothetical protein K2X09_02640 [Rickettsiales bacterium]|nr:hypothetical protein [Rickettsiales bacterium]